MRMALFSVFFLIATTFSVSGFSDANSAYNFDPQLQSFVDVQGTSCRRFTSPPEWNVFLIPDNGTVWEGLEPATCADINSAADYYFPPGTVWASGAGGMRCLYGVMYLYGNGFRSPPGSDSLPADQRPAVQMGVRGYASYDLSLAILNRCLEDSNNNQSRGCLERCGAGTSSSGEIIEVPNSTSVPTVPSAEIGVTPMAGLGL